MSFGVRLAILQPTSLCNLNCSYCYVPDRLNRALMSESVLRNAVRFVFASLPPDQRQVAILWHAGEPLTAGFDFYRNAFDIIEQERPAGVHVRYSFQTNATLVSEDWCRLLDQHDVSVGVSIDGPRELQDANRVSWSGRGSFDRAMRGVHLLREHGYDPPAICVLTPQALQCPDAVYEFFRDNAFPSVGFNIEESEGVHLRSRHLDASPGGVRALYKEFMRRIWDRRLADGNTLRIREFERQFSIIEKLRADRAFVATPDEAIPFANIVVRRNGEISTFAPELASTPSAEYGDFVVGNVMSDTPTAVREGDRLKRLTAAVEGGRAACRAQCAYFPVCGGGYQSNRYAEHGTLRATETTTCRLHLQALTDVVLTELAELSAD